MKASQSTPVMGDANRSYVEATPIRELPEASATCALRTHNHGDLTAARLGGRRCTRSTRSTRIGLRKLRSRRPRAPRLRFPPSRRASSFSVIEVIELARQDRRTIVLVGESRTSVVGPDKKSLEKSSAARLPSEEFLRNSRGQWHRQWQAREDSESG